MEFLKRTKGFTIFELLVVIALMGILIVLVLPNLNNGRLKVENDAKSATLDLVRVGLEEFYAECGVFPLGHRSTAGDYWTIDADSEAPGCLNKLGAFMPDGFDFEDIQYVPLKPNNISSNNDCLGYHVGIPMSGETSYLNSDDDAGTSYPDWTECRASVTGRLSGSDRDPSYMLDYVSSTIAN